MVVPRHLLVFINPVGGPGKGISEFKQHIQPMFDMAEINYNVIVTGKGVHRCGFVLLKQHMKVISLYGASCPCLSEGQAIHSLHC